MTKPEIPTIQTLMAMKPGKVPATIRVEREPVTARVVHELAAAFLDVLEGNPRRREIERSVDNDVGRILVNRLR